MTHEDKKLLIKDLCSRLPYGVKMKVNYGTNDITVELCGLDTDENTVNICRFRSENGKLCDNNNPLFTHMGESRYLPYLFPMSSMTEEQREKYESLCTTSYTRHYECGPIVYNTKFHDTVESIDYLIENHFDYHGLIPMGLAEDATGLNIY